MANASGAWRRELQAVLWGCLVVGVALPVAAQAPPKSDESSSVFGLTKVWTVHVMVGAESWKAMQPKGNGPNFGFPPPGGPGKPAPGKPFPGPGAEPGPKPSGKPGDAPPPPGSPPGTAPKVVGPPPAGKPGAGPGGAPFRPGSFGFEFDYVRGEVQFGDEVFRDVGIRFKGNGTYMMSQAGLKRPMKIDFDRYVPGQRFHGLEQINLQNNIMDPTNVRQTLSFPVFEAIGVPAPRTALAEVYLSVEGERESELLGVYTIVEEVNRGFLRRRFGDDRGMLLKPVGTQGIEFRGDDWAGYEWYEPKGKPTAAQKQRLIDFARLVHQADDETFRRELPNYLEVDQFLRFLAANALMANMDSFLTHVHNYYLYLVPQTNRFVFVPWDVDLSMGSFLMVGSAEQLQKLSVRHPHLGESKLIERTLKIDEYDRAYREHLRRLLADCFSPTGITLRDLPRVRAAIEAPMRREELEVARRPGPAGPFPGGGRGGPFGNLPSLETFIAARVASIESQLAGKDEGYVPKMAFGPGGGGPPKPGDFLAEPLRKALDANDDGKLSAEEVRAGAKTFFAKSDRQSTGVLTDDTFCEGMARTLPPPPGVPAGPPDPPPGGGPARFLALPVFEAADADKDKRLTLADWLKATDDLFAKADADRSGALDAQELAKAFEIVFAPRP